MKLMKKATALLAVCAIAIGMTACGTSDTGNEIVAENANTKITMGAYAYCMYDAYYYAGNLVPDATATSILSQEIDGQSVSDWMREQAASSMKGMFFVDAKAKELGITLTDTERKEIDDQMDSVWVTTQDSIKQMLDYGITKEGAKQFYLEFNQKYTKIFETIYGENGTKAVSADEKKTYFTENYTDLAYFQKSVYSLTDEEKATAKETLDAYATAINDKSKTMEQVAEEYKTAESLTTDPLQTAVTNLATATSYPTAMVTALNEMQPGEARVIDLSGTSYVLVVKNDINAVVDEKLQDEATNFSILKDMKSEEYIADMSAELENYTDFTIHENVANKFDPAVFEKTADASSTESTAANNATSQASNDTTSSQTTTSN